MLRVSSGKAKNKKLEVPAIEGFRPVQEISKQAVFSIIGDKITESTCLDLYSGSGNMGIEALSRGASGCDFVDLDYKSIGTIRNNLSKCGFLPEVEVKNSKTRGTKRTSSLENYLGNDLQSIVERAKKLSAEYEKETQNNSDKIDDPEISINKSDAVKYVVNCEKMYDFIFIDPFYKETAHKFLFKNLSSILKPKGLIFFFHGKELNVDEIIKDSGLQVQKQRKFGNSVFSVISGMAQDIKG